MRRHMGREAPDLAGLRGPALREGFALVQRTLEDWDVEGPGGSANRFDGAGEAFFLALIGGRTVGMCGLNLDPFAGDPRVGRLRHLYVHPSHRGARMGRRLVDACLEVARGPFDRVRLRTFEASAAEFYGRLGFELVDEPDATHSIRVFAPPR
ncbi:MAG: GNAT family N-acetyltransferase [Myxococcota bacterium]